MIKGSRLLVLVEDTTATRDLWPIWRAQALEPFLKRLESAEIGRYDLNLIAFASTTTDGVLRSGDWTPDVQRFRRYLDQMAFEGSSGSSGLASALTEAKYLIGQPSGLQGMTHVLVCATGFMSAQPVLWPGGETGESRSHAYSILMTKLSSLGVTLSIITESGKSPALSKIFASVAGLEIAEKCKKLSGGKGCLCLIHPSWRHGFKSVFPDCDEIPEPTNGASTSESSSKTVTSFPRVAVPVELKEGPEINSRTLFAEVIDLSTCRKRRAPPSWKTDDPQSSELYADQAGICERQVLGETTSRDLDDKAEIADSPAMSSTKSRAAELSIKIPDDMSTGLNSPCKTLSSAPSTNLDTNDSSLTTVTGHNWRGVSGVKRGNLLPSPQLRIENDLRAAKRPRKNTSSTLEKAQHIVETGYSSPKVPRQVQRNNGTEGWNVCWSGSLYLDGHLVREAQPRKLFDIEILSRKPVEGRLGWPTDLLVKNMAPKELLECQACLLVRVKDQSLTKTGYMFRNRWLSERKMAAHVDLGSPFGRLVLFVKSVGQPERYQLVAALDGYRNP